MAARQSSVRQRTGYAWLSCVGLPAAALVELDGIKRELGLSSRYDVVASILGEVGYLEPLVREGLAKLLPTERGGTETSFYLPKPLVDCVTKASTIDQIPLERSRVLAAVLAATRPRYAELARAGFARKMALPTKVNEGQPRGGEA